MIFINLMGESVIVTTLMAVF